MLSAGSRRRLALILIGLLLVLAPLAILGATFVFLKITGNLVLGRVTTLEFLELYLIDLVIVVSFGYGLYRLLMWLGQHRLPDLLDTLETGADPDERSDPPDLDGDDRD